jgi:nucleotide-binding universal stress UspA family protein
MKTILAPLDFSPVSKLVLAEALRLARPRGARVVLTHVILPPIYPMDFYGVVVDQLTTFATVAEVAANRRLQRLQKRLKGAVEILPAETGRPAATILDQARKLKPDLIVLGSHGHGLMHDLILGSTAQGVIRRSPCPVLVVPALRPRGQAGRR